MSGTGGDEPTYPPILREAVRVLVEEAQNAVWNGQDAADAALGSVTDRIVRLLDEQAREAD